MKLTWIAVSRCCLSTAVLSLIISLTAFGQAGRGSISGTIVDSSGAVIPGATVTLLNTATGVTQQTTASGAGLYAFISLNPGVYRVTADHGGFATEV